MCRRPTCQLHPGVCPRHVASSTMLEQRIVFACFGKQQAALVGFRSGRSSLEHPDFTRVARRSSVRAGSRWWEGRAQGHIV